MKKRATASNVMLSIGVILICCGGLAIIGGLNDSDVIIGSMAFFIPGLMLLGLGINKRRQNIQIKTVENQIINNKEESEIAPTVGDSDIQNIERNNKRKIVVGIVICLFVTTIIICIFEDGSNDNDNADNNKYYNCIEVDNTSISGAVFDYSFSDVKTLIGRNLSIGDLNSSSGGWNQISSTSEYTEYNIVSTGDIWAVNVGVDANEDVFTVVCKTTGIDNGNPSDSEIEDFASVFAEIIGVDLDSTYSVLKNLCVSGNKSRSYSQGICFSYEKTSGGSCCFGITAMSEEYWNSIK